MEYQTDQHQNTKDSAPESYKLMMVKSSDTLGEGVFKVIEMLTDFSEEERAVIVKAIHIIQSKAMLNPILMTSSGAAGRFCQVQIGAAASELFGVLFLDTQHRLISFDIMFRGTIDAASVYPRDVVTAALKHNAKSVIFTHNHPSGTLEQSRADVQITNRLKSALELVDINVLDHFIVSTAGHMSFAAEGLL